MIVLNILLPGRILIGLLKALLYYGPALIVAACLLLLAVYLIHESKQILR